MAKTLLPFSPQSHFLKNHILGTQIIRETNLKNISPPWSSSTRIFSPIFDIHDSHFTKLYCKNNINKNTKSTIKLHVVRRLSSISATSLSPVLDSHHLICSYSHSLCFPSFSLFSLQRSCSPSLGISMMATQAHSDGTNNPTSQDSTKTVRCVIKGRVQGVFYRNWTVENATQLGLKGWVRNRRDGSVEALFSGKANIVDEMMQRCRRGPPDAMVTAFEASPCNEDPGTGFERRSTV